MIRTLKCPECGGVLGSKCTYTSDDYTVYRVRKCRDCGFLYNSIEKPADNKLEFCYQISLLKREKYANKKFKDRMTQEEYRKMQDERYNEIWALHEKGYTAKEIAYEYKMTATRINQILREKRKEKEMGQLSKSMFVLQDYLESIKDKYTVSFNNEVMNNLLYIRVTDGTKTEIDKVGRGGLTDENYLVDAIKKIISKMEKEGV